MRCMDTKIMNIIILICTLTLAFIALINWFVFGSFWIDSFFRMLFLVIACVFTGFAPYPWLPFIQSNFQFLYKPFWKSGFMIILACFFFPCFKNGCWSGWSVIFQNIAALVLFVIGLIELILELVDCRQGNTVSETHTTRVTTTTTQYTINSPK
ncbi:Hypothetical_protein [Hexamita inflata]|uniref:Hypothetical_protein n=1 Tax=Hexamita inflata TaxID=28002 RepID=A0AA86P001_9EUKA|nr:Hypothetical protein HINF_LOCUS15562 [Hexamita inflata]